MTKDEDWRALVNIANSPKTPAKVLAELAKDEDSRVRVSVAENPKTPVEILAELAKNSDSDIRIGVAKNFMTPSEILTQLAKDEKYDVRVFALRGFARKPDTPVEMLVQLAKEPDEAIVRIAVAENIKTPVEVLMQLSKDERNTVRMAVANNLKTPAEVLTKLAKDRDPDVRSVVGRNPKTPAKSLAQMAIDEKGIVRIAVGRNPKTPAESLTMLAIDIDPDVRMSVINNPKTPVKLLMQLAKDIDPDICKFAEFVKNEKSQKNNIMNEKTKTYLGNSYKIENEKGTFYQFAVKREEIEKLQGIGKHNEIAIAIEPKREVKGEKHPTHNVYFSNSDNAHAYRELQLFLSKDELLRAQPIDEYGNIKLLAASRNEDKMGADLSNYSVSLSDSKDEDGKHVFVGRGYDASTKFGETRVVGVAYRHEFGNNGEDGKSYSLNLDAKKMLKLDIDDYGNAKLGIIPYNVSVANLDGTVSDETRYLVAETNSQRTNIEATVSVHLANTEFIRDAQGNINRLPTLSDCNVHTIGENNVYKLVVQDKNPEKIGKDCSDLVVFEDKYMPEMKDMSSEEIKAAKAAEKTNFVGKGWTNDPAKIKLSAADLTQEGLSKAIENNHLVKVIAVVKHSPDLVQSQHVAQAQTKSAGLAKWVTNTYNSKQAPPQQISNIKFTDKQLATLQAGKAVKAEGLEIKNGANAGKKVDRWITWDNKTGKCKFHEAEPKPKAAVKAAVEQKQPQSNKKDKGMKI
ncbi:MAG: DUF3945 domain-containing protein [Prevotellaceae bacterium]|jgi:hypothetical protein|nr:DUF3945 domain-containing protein [Prevotellaceae bacterium]